MNKILSSKYAYIIVTIIFLIISILFIFYSSSQNQKNGLSNNQVKSTNPKLDNAIFQLQSAINSNPKVTKNYFDLSNAFLQKVRETGDSTYYSKIENLLDKVEKLDPKNADVPAIRASIAIGRHHFKEAKEFAEKALTINPNREIYYGLLGDAEIELGQYQNAVDNFQKMVDIRPDFSSYSRIAYIRELYGDIPGAKVALNQAITSGSNFNENIA